MAWHSRRSIRDRETKRHQEIRCEPQRRGTRAAQRTDFQGQAPGAAVAARAYPAEGGRLGRRGCMERQPDRRGAGYQRRYRCTHAPAAGRGRLRVRAGPQAVAERRQAAHFRWRRRSQADRAGLFATAQGTCAVDLAAAGRTRRAIEDRRAGVGQYDRANAQKNTLKPHLQQQWVIPPEANAAFVAGMEDVLEVYHRPHDPERPLVCLDETSKQLVAETRVPIPARAARPKRVDYQYARNSLPLRRRGAPPIYSCCSRRWRAGGTSNAPTVTRHSIMPRS